MKIEVDPILMVRLNGYAIAAKGQEFSGLGFCELRKDVIWVYDFVIFDVGSEVFTEIPTPELMQLMQRPDYKNMKLWIHKHPVGPGVPGPHNWSGTDNATIELAPLGGIPELVRWSVSMVLTPGGWVGRIDNHLTHKTEHLDVSPNIQPAIAEIRAIVQKKYVEVQAKREKEEAERLEAVSALAETIRARVEELDQNILDDLGISREDLEEMALEQAGILDYPLLEREEDLDDPQNNDLENYDAYLFDNMDEYDTKGTKGYTFPSRDEKKAQRRLGRGSY